MFIQLSYEKQLILKFGASFLIFSMKYIIWLFAHTWRIKILISLQNSRNSLNR